MNNKQQSKVRFVRCPKCTKILQEPDHVPLYTCGGCSTILQAKNYKGPPKNTELCSLEQEVPKKNGVIHACDGGDSSGSSRRSSSDQPSAQDKGINSDVDENFKNTEQKGAVSSFDNSSLSKEYSSLQDKENGEIDEIESNKNSKSEQNQAANFSENTALSKESSSFKSTKNGEIDDSKSAGSCSETENKGSANYNHQTALSEESNFTENKENRVRDMNIDRSDSMDRGANDNSTSLENEHQKLIKVDSAKERDSGQDEECNDIVIEDHIQKQIGDVNSGREVFTQVESTEEEDEHEEKLVRHVKSTKEVSSPTESAAIENPAEHHASDHELSQETWKVQIEGKLHEQNKDSLKGSSWIESPDIIKPTHFASESPANYDASVQQQSKEIKLFHQVQNHSHSDLLKNDNIHDLDEQEVENRVKENGNGTDPIEDASSLTTSQLTQLASENLGNNIAFNHDVSNETSKIHLVEVHSQQDMSGNSINHLDADGAEVEKLGKEHSNGKVPNDITEQLGNVQISRAHSLSTVPTRGGNDESLYVSTASCATDLKISYEMVSGDPLQHQRNYFDNVKGTSKQNSENVGKKPVYEDYEVGTFVNEIPESSSKRSPAYDGSVSSFDGNDDQVAEQHPQIGKETLSPNNAVAGSDGAEGSPEWNNLPSEHRIFSNVRAQRPPRGSSIMASDDKLKTRVIEEERPLEAHGIPRRFRPNRENFLPRVPYRRRSSEMTYEAGSTSSYALHKEAPRRQMHSHDPYGRRYPEAPLWREKEFLPPYYTSETSGEIYERPEHYSYMDRRRRTESWFQSGVLPRMPYSGEMINGRYPNMRRYREDRRWSEQLPPPAIYFHQGGYMNPGWETRWDPYDSYPTSPQRFMESESSYAWGHDTICFSDDQRHKDQIMRRMYLREKRQAVKTSYHPIAGGTPFITCRFCFNILHIPQGFLLSRRRRRTHELKCGACSNVLEFSLGRNEDGLTALETNINRNMNVAMSSHPHVNHSHQSSVNSADRRVLLSRDSSGAPIREKRNLGPGSSSNGERTEGLHVDDDEPPLRGRPPKISWQLPARSKSPLHKLMGYSSPNELITFHEDDVE